MAPYYLISDVYDRKFKYYRTPRVFAVEIRKCHQKNPLETFYEIEQCKIAINYKLGILEQCKLTIPPWPEMEDIKRSGVRAHVFLIIQCTIQISGSVLANTKWLFIFTSIAR